MLIYFFLNFFSFEKSIFFNTYKKILYQLPFFLEVVVHYVCASSNLAIRTIYINFLQNLHHFLTIYSHKQLYFYLIPLHLELHLKIDLNVHLDHQRKYLHQRLLIFHTYLYLQGKMLHQLLLPKH